MKRTWITALLAVSLVPAVPALAKQSVASPILGTWALDVSKMAIPPEQRPRSVTFTFTDVGAGKWRTQVEIVAADGKATVSTVTHTLDGTPAVVENSIEADRVAMTSPTPNVLIMALSNKGVPSSMRVISVGPDRNAETETAVYYQQDGTPVMRRSYFKRVR